MCKPARSMSYGVRGSFNGSFRVRVKAVQSNIQCTPQQDSKRLDPCLGRLLKSTNRGGSGSSLTRYKAR